jgi:hypothetical protein
MLRIPWTALKTNDEVLTTARVDRELLITVMRRKLIYFGHLIRQNGLQQLLMEGRIDGARNRRRPRITWVDNIRR